MSGSPSATHSGSQSQSPPLPRRRPQHCRTTYRCCLVCLCSARGKCPSCLLAQHRKQYSGVILGQAKQKRWPAPSCRGVCPHPRCFAGSAPLALLYASPDRQTYCAMTLLADSAIHNLTLALTAKNMLEDSVIIIAGVRAWALELLRHMGFGAVVAVATDGTPRVHARWGRSSEWNGHCQRAEVVCSSPPAPRCVAHDCAGCVHRLQKKTPKILSSVAQFDTLFCLLNTRRTTVASRLLPATIGH